MLRFRARHAQSLERTNFSSPEGAKEHRLVDVRYIVRPSPRYSWWLRGGLRGVTSHQPFPQDDKPSSSYLHVFKINFCLWITPLIEWVGMWHYKGLSFFFGFFFQVIHIGFYHLTSSKFLQMPHPILCSVRDISFQNSRVGTRSFIFLVSTIIMTLPDRGKFFSAFFAVPSLSHKKL